MSDTQTREIILQGIGAAPGICVGKAYLVDKEGVNVVRRYAVPEDLLQNEKNRFRTAVKKAREELIKIISESSKEFQEHTNILETHLILLKDKMLYDKIIENIEQDKINAEWALKKVVSNLQSVFKNMSDPYFRERASDIVHVADRIMRNLTGAGTVDIKGITKRVILVAADLSPADTSQIQLENIMGFITDRGGITSHTGIIARTLEIPAVLGLEHSTHVIRNDDIIVVDGSSGEVIVHPSEETLVKFVKRRLKYEAFRAAILKGSHFPAKTIDGVTVSIMGNIELPEEVVSVRDNGGDGIGLYRTEFQYMSRLVFPNESELFDKYRDVIEVMSPKPVTIRTLDINGDKAISDSRHDDEENPALGLRGIRYCLKKPDIFKTQLRAILRAAAFGNVRVMFPMICCFGEILAAKQMFREAAGALEKEGARLNREIEIGIMIEVPSAVVIADLMAEEVDFFSIGTNDLIQYSLAIDRGNKYTSHLYHPLHPAIIRMLKQVSDVAKEKKIKLFMCGEMAGDPFNLPILLALGIDELSMNPQSIPVIKRMIRSLKAADTEMLLKEILKQKTSSDIMELLNNAYGDLVSEVMNGQMAVSSANQRAIQS